MQQTALYDEQGIYPRDHRLSRVRFLWFMTLPITFLVMLKGAMAFLGGFSMAMLHDLFDVILKPFLLIFVVFCVSNMVRRLHDLNQTGWYACLCVLPYINVVFFSYLLFMPGNLQENIYGPVAKSNEHLDYLFMLLFGLPGLGIVAYNFGTYLSWVYYIFDKFVEFITWLI